MKVFLACLLACLLLSGTEPIDKTLIKKQLTGEGTKQWRKKFMMVKGFLMQNDCIWEFDATKVKVMYKDVQDPASSYETDAIYSYKIGSKVTLDGVKNLLYIKGKNKTGEKKNWTYQIERLTEDEMELKDTMAYIGFISPPGRFIVE